LDLSLFGIIKQLTARVNHIEEEKAESFHIAEAVCSFLSAADRINVIQSFQNTGIHPSPPMTYYVRCLLDREKVLTTSFICDEDEIYNDLLISQEEGLV
jgi:hypothetical protein